jgi:hypothetical protein
LRHARPLPCENSWRTTPVCKNGFLRRAGLRVIASIFAGERGGISPRKRAVVSQKRSLQALAARTTGIKFKAK